MTSLQGNFPIKEFTGYYINLGQLTGRRIQNPDFIAWYKEDALFAHWVRKVVALPFVPERFCWRKKNLQR